MLHTFNDNSQQAESEESGESESDVVLLGTSTEGSVVEVMFYFIFPYIICNNL